MWDIMHNGMRSLLLLLIIAHGNARSQDGATNSLPTANNASDTKPIIISDLGHGNDGNGTNGHYGNDTVEHTEHHVGIHVASWNFDYVRQPFVITSFLILTAISKLCFHHAGILPRIFPESCLLIVLGTVVGGILHACDLQLFGRQMSPKMFFLVLLPPVTNADKRAYATFTSALFFLILLPPIILESSYSLHDRVFGDNIGTILLYAVIGTVINCCLLAPTLYGLALSGAMGTISISLIQCFVFSSLIVAVDPVAVLAIFQEIGVNNVLYFLVFGESLLNDAVTVVLYNMMKAFNEMETVPLGQIFLGIASFFTISLGGLAIGIMFGIFTSLLTKTTMKVRVMEPLAIFTLAYASYLSAELFHFSGIISTIGCGLVQAQYAFHNISHKSYTTVIYFSKMMSTTSDCIIFMFLGLALVRDDHVWHTGFILWTVFLCLVFRFLGVYFLTFLANRLDRLRIIDYEEQFIMAYGGLRGAVAFSLVAMLNKKTLSHQPLFETATLAVIIFTVFVQGITIKPLVKLLRIKRSDTKVVSMSDEINKHVTDHVMAGIEEIVGYHGHNSFREIMGYYDDRYLKNWMQRCPQTKDDQIMELYGQIALQEYYDNNIGALDMERYSSQMELYPCKRGTEDDSFVGLAQTHPELLDRALDDHIKRISSNPSSPVLPYARRLGTSQPISPGGDAESPISTPQPGTPRPGTPLPGTPLPDASRRSARSSLLALVRGQSIQEDDVFVEEPTVEHLRRWLVKNPSKQVYHQKYDRNLIRGEDNDLLHHLHEKQRRIARLKKSMSMSYTPGGSAMGSPFGSPMGSMENVTSQRPHSNLGVISESVSEEAISQPSAHTKPPVERRVKTRPPMNKAYSLDSRSTRSSVPQARRPPVYASRRSPGHPRQPIKAASFDKGYVDPEAERSPLLPTKEPQEAPSDIPEERPSSVDRDLDRQESETGPGQEDSHRRRLSRQNKVRDHSPTSRPFVDAEGVDMTTDTVPSSEKTSDVESKV